MHKLPKVHNGPADADYGAESDFVEHRGNRMSEQGFDNDDDGCHGIHADLR